MTTRALIALTGLLIAACGHLVLNDVRGAATVWARLDGRFPAQWRTSPSIGGLSLLGLGALWALTALLG
jgi:hypothetical protein